MVVALAQGLRPELRVEAVVNAPVFAHDQYVDDAARLLSEEGKLAPLVNLVEVLARSDALVGERDAGREGLFLLGDEDGVALLFEPVEVELHAERGYQQQRHHREQPRAEAVEENGQSHRSLRKAFPPRRVRPCAERRRAPTL